MAANDLIRDLSKLQPVPLKIEEINKGSRKGGSVVGKGRAGRDRPWINDGSVSPVEFFLEEA
jgi:hypothetical protein